MSRAHAQARRRPASLLAAALTIAVCAVLPAAAQADHGTRYRQTNLVSDIPGLAQLTDPNLLNPWGMAAGPSTPVWVSDNGADVATLYQGGLKRTPVSAVPLVVGIPGGEPTGQVFNPTAGFVVKSGMSSGPATFIFASESGNITGWNRSVPPPPPSTQAQPAASTPDAVYKGLAMASSGGQPYLYATDFHHNRIDVFDSSFKPVTLAGDFTDPGLPAHFAPFGIQAFGNVLLVTYAMQDADAHDDVAGPGNGFVDVFSSSGQFLRRLISRGALNSPWGLAIAPSGFGAFSHALLVGNFGDGTIHGYDPRTGHFLGTLLGKHGMPIQNDGLWALRFGNGVAGSPRTLLFTAGLNEEADGLFGEIQQGHHH
jgi:uncharacterized protein (TIGR03118 family)